MRRGLAAAVIVLVAPALALAAPALKPGPTSKVHGPEFGTSGGDEPYLVALSPRDGGGVLAAYVTRSNLTDTPPGDFIGRALDEHGVPAGPGVTWTRKNSNLQQATAALDREGKSGLAIWNEYEDGEGHDAGPVFVRRFDAATAEPLESPRRILRNTELIDMAPLGEGFAVVHRPFDETDVAVQLLDGQGTPTGEPALLDLYYPALVASVDRQRVALIQTFGSRRIAVAIVDTDGIAAAPRKLTGLTPEDVLDYAAAPGGDWLVLARVRERLQVRALTGAGTLRGPTFIGNSKDKFYGYELAFAGRRGLVAGYVGRRCDGGFAAIPLGAAGKALADAPTKLTVPPACKTASILDTDLSASGGRRFVLGWTHSNGRAGHRIYATGIRR